MDSTTTATTTVVNDKQSMVDPFLVEALQNPRHRLTILRMELDIQRFLQNPDQQYFEFQHFPTSYLRLAAHRVSQHYGLVTMVQENGLDGLGNRILVRKTAESKYPAVHLSEIPAKQSEESDKLDQVKIVIRPRPNGGSINEANEFGVKRSPVRSVEERKEEYDRARARIFSSPGCPDPEETLSQVPNDGKGISLSRDENESSRNSVIDSEKIVSIRDGSSSRVAIFRDREKDRTDPDYDRSYDRYVRSLPANQGFGLAPFNMRKVQLPFIQYDTSYPQLGQIPRTQASLNYRPTTNAIMSPYCTTGQQTSMEAAYVQWPSAAMMYANSYEQFRHAVFQAPFCKQPLSFDYNQNH
ncbi:cAMP-regulated phosphoprotein 21-like isoform X2 [Mangifera indica]|uniref:cAMP-regulated phosphoprotein 21-like isoform X2 n=1 Tax=Mangifera indica TaxID=29780 RepID=UPI001CFC15A5|nr:cAMP-regulated phosphoprotein 21-like isoform X2 [Mangifera indica]